MKTKHKIIAVLTSFTAPIHAQNVYDTICFKNGEKIGCVVSRISLSEIEFSYPGETHMNVENKSSVNQIRFKSGRVQSFLDAAETNHNSNCDQNQGHGEFWGIPMGGDVTEFVDQLKAKGAKVLEYKDDEVKLESAFMSFESADIYVHFNKMNVVTYVDVQQNHSFKRTKETKGIVTELNEKYKLIKEGSKPWVIAIYRWEWLGENLLITFNRVNGYARPHLRFCDAQYVGCMLEDE